MMVVAKTKCLRMSCVCQKMISVILIGLKYIVHIPLLRAQFCVIICVGIWSAGFEGRLSENVG